MRGAVERFFLFTLGCKVNQYESHALREAWLEQGGKEALVPEDANTILVNSCAVTARAVADLRAALRRLRRAAPHARIIVTGCAARALEADRASIPEADELVFHEDKADLVHGLFGKLPESDCKASDTAIASFPPFRLSGYNRSRAVLKIQDGCSHGCAYCFVPLARGRARSRSYEESVAEARRLLDAGFREIVISGVNLRQYHEPGGGDFWDFLARLDAELAPQWAGQARFRVSSLEPGQMGQKALHTLAACRLVAPHLHISLQSGSPAVLERMGRGHYNPEALPRFLAALGGIWPRFGLGADILCGFPGESETEAQESLALIKALPLSYAHVFPYSKRPGTRAAAMPGQVPAPVKKARAAEVRAVVDDKKQLFWRSLLEQKRLLAVFDQGKGSGVCEYYADCLVEPGSALPVKSGNSLVAVRPVGLGAKGLLVQPEGPAGQRPFAVTGNLASAQAPQASQAMQAMQAMQADSAAPPGKEYFCGERQ